MAPSPAGQLSGSLQFSLKKASEWKMQMWSRVLKTFEVLNCHTLGTKFKQQAQHFGLQEPLGFGDPGQAQTVLSPHPMGMLQGWHYLWSLGMPFLHSSYEP